MITKYRSLLIKWIIDYLNTFVDFAKHIFTLIILYLLRKFFHLFLTFPIWLWQPCLTIVLIKFRNVSYDTHNSRNLHNSRVFIKGFYNLSNTFMNHCRNGVLALHHPISSFVEGGQTRSNVLPLFHLKMRVMPRSTSFYRVYWTIVRRPGEGPEMDAMILMRRTSQVALARLLTFPFPLLSCVSHVAQKNATYLRFTS